VDRIVLHEWRSKLSPFQLGGTGALSSGLDASGRHSGYPFKRYATINWLSILTTFEKGVLYADDEFESSRK
jgi:hypothetical protein